MQVSQSHNTCISMQASQTKPAFHCRLVTQKLSSTVWSWKKIFIYFVAKLFIALLSIAKLLTKALRKNQQTFSNFILTNMHFIDEYLFLTRISLKQIKTHHLG